MNNFPVDVHKMDVNHIKGNLLDPIEEIVFKIIRTNTCVSFVISHISRHSIANGNALLDDLTNNMVG